MSSQFQNKLLHYEVQPPATVWNKVAAALEDNQEVLHQKLAQFEAAPPPATWEKIEAQLDATVKQETKVVPFFTRYRRPLKYSGAVAIFVVMATVVSLLISKRTESETPADTVVTTLKDTNKVDKTIKNDVAKSLEKNDAQPTPVTKVSKTKPVAPPTRQIVSTSVSSNKYMIVNDDDGNAIRLPKKLYTAFACPTNNVDCKERLRKLKEKFAASAITSDFTGILEILKSLQENQ